MRPNRIGWAIVSLFLIGGVVFWVRIPEVWIGQIWVAVSLFLAGLYLVMIRRANRADELKREGIPGRAQILEMTQTGTYVNEQPRVRLKLRVEAPGVPTFESEDTYTVPLVALGALSGGGWLPVYLDREDPSKFAIDWGGRPPEASPSPFDVEETPEGRLRKLQDLKDEGLITDADFEREKSRILGAI